MRRPDLAIRDPEARWKQYQQYQQYQQQQEQVRQQKQQKRRQQRQQDRLKLAVDASIAQQSSLQLFSEHEAWMQMQQMQQIQQSQLWGQQQQQIQQHQIQHQIQQQMHQQVHHDHDQHHQHYQHQSHGQDVIQNPYLESITHAHIMPQVQPVGFGGLMSQQQWPAHAGLLASPSSPSINSNAPAVQSPGMSMVAWANQSSLPVTGTNANYMAAGPIAGTALAGQREPAMPQAQQRPRHRRPSEASSYRGPVSMAAANFGYEQAALSPASGRYPQTPEMPFTPISMVSSHDGASMSRTNSFLTGASMAEPFNRARRDSTTSHYAPHHFSPLQNSADVVVGAGASLATCLTMSPFETDVDDFDVGVSYGVDACPMERSSSITSNKSGALHTGQRAKEATQRHILNGKTEIRPKPLMSSSSSSAATTVMDMSQLSPISNPPLSTTATTTTTNNNNNHTAMPVSRPTTKRPKMPKVQCKHCDEHPEGFRGDHELRRHVTSKHTARPKRWMCQTPPAGTSSLVPFKPLSDCKHCSEGKQYKRHDNAVAHLRRSHFSNKAPKAKTSKVKKTGVVAIAEGRGGKSGGNKPSLVELGPWLHDFTISLTPDDDDDESDGAEDDDDDDDDNVDGVAVNHQADEMMAQQIFDNAPPVGVPVDLNGGAGPAAGFLNPNVETYLGQINFSNGLIGFENMTWPEADMSLFDNAAPGAHGPLF
jgi:hypothetical protein